MGTKTVFYTIESENSLVEMKAKLKQSLLFLGGTLVDYDTGFQLKQGTNGVNYAFAANFEAMISIRQPALNKYEIWCAINWSPNTLFWICLVVGVFVFGILWIVPILYLFIDPTSAYQNALFRVQSMASTGHPHPLPV